MAAKDEAVKQGTALDRDRYSDREVAQILRRAVALQEKQGAGTGRGLSLEEMKEVAREVGVDPRFVVEAAHTLARSAAAGGNRVLGGPTRMNAVQVLEQRFRMVQMAGVIEELRHVTGHHGRAAQLADSIEWYGKDSLGAMHVSVSRVGGETRVRVMGNRTEAAAVLYSIGGSIAVIVAGIVGGALSQFGPAAVALGVAGFTGASLLALRSAWSHYARRWDQRVRSTLGSVVNVLRDTGDEPGHKG